MGDRLALLQAELPQHRIHAVGGEDAHEIVFQRQEELGGAGIALAAGAAAQLIVDAAALMPLGADDVEAAALQRDLLVRRDLGPDRGGPALALGRVLDAGRLLADAHVDVAAELDVGAAAGHVGGDGHAARRAGLGDDVGLLLVIARVQHLVRNLALLELFRQHLGLLDADRADQHRLLARAGLLDQRDDGVVLLLGRAIDLVVMVQAHARQVGRHLDHLEAVDVHQLRRLGHRRAGHARELRIHAEVVLEGDGGVGRGLPLDLHAFLGLERLVQPFRIAPARHHAAGELVDDDDLAVLHDVVGIAAEQLVGAQRLVDVVDQRDVVEVVEMLALHQVGLARASARYARRPARSA